MLRRFGAGRLYGYQCTKPRKSNIQRKTTTVAAPITVVEQEEGQGFRERVHHQTEVSIPPVPTPEPPESLLTPYLTPVVPGPRGVT